MLRRWSRALHAVHAGDWLREAYTRASTRQVQALDDKRLIYLTGRQAQHFLATKYLEQDTCKSKRKIRAKITRANAME